MHVSVLCVLLLLAGEVFAQPFTLVNAFSNLTFTRPVLVTHAGDGTNRVFVVQQNGLIRMFQNDSTVSTASTFLNLTNKITSVGNEQGLLGLAFHPNFRENGYLYVNYTATGTGRTVVARYNLLPGNPSKADSLSEVKLLEVYQPFTNHNAGMILFGNDGHLYITLGDGGSGGDPGNRAQNVDSLLGKILRINVDSSATGTNYVVPPDNPFVGIPGRDEIFATGFRNPWRISVDPVSGQIWVGDVGQGAWEEIDLLEKGKNYGWRCYEGNATYNTTGCGSMSNYTFPVKVYANSSPDIAVTGGYIYRGHRRPDLAGAYVYADYGSGKIWRLRYNGGVVSDEALLIDAPFSLSSFGTDELGELYMCNLGGGTIHRFAGGPPTANTILVEPGYKSHNVVADDTLRWRSAPGALSYWLQVARDPAFDTLVVSDSTLTDTTFSANSLSTSTRYYWRVRVKNANGWGIGTTIWSFTTALPPPAAPALLAPSNGVTAQPTSLNLHWMPVPGAGTYHVQLADDSLFGTVQVDLPAVTDTFAVVNGLQHSTTFYWRVRAIGGGGPGPWSDTWWFRTRLETTGSYEVRAGWNVVSVPLTVNNTRSSVLFPTSVSGAYGFQRNTGYVLRDSLQYGIGYWVKFDMLQMVQITGIVREQDTVSVFAGWNLVGAFSVPVDTQQVIQNPPGVLVSPFYKYGGTYEAADSLMPAKGYWVKASGPGQIIFIAPQPQASKQTPATVRPTPDEDLIQLQRNGDR